MTNEQEWWKPNGDYLFLPKALFREAEYHSLSPLARLLYAFLLDRYRQSRKNGEAWQTETGAYFV